MASYDVRIKVKLKVINFDEEESTRSFIAVLIFIGC